MEMRPIRFTSKSVEVEFDEHLGVWINPSAGARKIAAVGMAVRQGITRHGLALTVAPQMAHFDLLMPCGIADRGVTSMERELGRAPDLGEVADRFVQAFTQVFRCQVVEGDPACLSSSARKGGAPFGSALYHRAASFVRTTTVQLDGGGGAVVIP